MAELTIDGINEPALVDDCWAHLKLYRWRLDKQGYVMRKAGGKRVYLHHVILPGQRYPMFVRDHVNRDKLDNRSSNLRWLTLAESAQNKNAYRKNPTGVRGVRLHEGRYLATVQTGGRAVARCWCASIEEASRYLDAVRPLILPASSA